VVNIAAFDHRVVIEALWMGGRTSGIQTTTVCLQFKDADLREVYKKAEF
jgi:hypothetical protein